MSMWLDFEPHSWYKHFAIRHMPLGTEKWTAYTDDGNTYRIVEFEADTLKELKLKISQYWQRRK